MQIIVTFDFSFPAWREIHRYHLTAMRCTLIRCERKGSAVSVRLRISKNPPFAAIANFQNPEVSEHTRIQAPRPANRVVPRETMVRFPHVTGVVAVQHGIRGVASCTAIAGRITEYVHTGGYIQHANDASIRRVFGELVFGPNNTHRRSMEFPPRVRSPLTAVSSWLAGKLFRKAGKICFWPLV